MSSIIIHRVVLNGAAPKPTVVDLDDFFGARPIPDGDRFIPPNAKAIIDVDEGLCEGGGCYFVTESVNEIEALITEKQRQVQSAPNPTM